MSICQRGYLSYAILPNSSRSFHSCHSVRLDRLFVQTDTLPPVYTAYLSTMSCIEAGIFTNVKDDDFVSFNVRLGEPEEEARKMRGTHWKTHIIDLGDKAFLVHATCVEHPELDSLEVFKEGDVMHVDSPFFGGKAKVTYVTTGPNRYLTTAETEDIGTLEITEIYSEEGMKAITVHKDTGATLEEFYTRRLKEEGWFRTTTQEEDLAEFFSLTGAKKNFTGEYKLKAEKIVGRSDGIALTEVLNGFENRNEFTFDTEMERVLSFGKGQLLALFTLSIRSECRVYFTHRSRSN